MQETWRGAGLSNTDNKLLETAVAADLPELEKSCEDKSKLDSVDTAKVSLGKLGEGVIVRVSGSCMCGVTGNCPIYVYAREKDRYRAVLGGEQRKMTRPYGWAFAVVSSKAQIPDLVIASNSGGGVVALTLYRYVGDRFVAQASETLTKKDGAEGKSWWDPSTVWVRP